MQRATIPCMDATAIRKALGHVIRRRRRVLGYSQETFADEVGLHRTYVGSVERGERNLSLTNLIRIANSLQMSPSVLLAEAETDTISEEPTNASSVPRLQRSR